MRSACARQVARAPSGPAPPRRISSRSCSNSATASTSADGGACADAPSCPPPSGMAAWYFQPVTAPLARYARAMRVGLSLLTLVPGVVGGSETYARELCRALARVGELDYAVFVPTLAPAAGDGLPTTVVPEYRAGTTTAGRLAAMSLATAMPKPIRRRFDRADLAALHFPLSVMIPRVDRPARRDDGARPPARALSGVLLARGARVPSRRLRVDREAQPPADRDLRARPIDLARAVRTAARARPHDPPRPRPRTAHAGWP